MGPWANQCAGPLRDLSHIDQLTITVRQVLDGAPTKRFLTLLPIESHKAEDLVKYLANFLKSREPGNGLHPHLTDVYSPFSKSKGPPLPVRTSSAISPPAVSQVVPHVSTRLKDMAENSHFFAVFPKSKGATLPRTTSSAISPPAVSQVVPHVSTRLKSMAKNCSTVCRSCDEEIATVKFHPCGHTLFCEVCSIPMKKCMLCRSRIESKSEGMTKSRTMREVKLLKQQLNQVIEKRQCEICMERVKVMVFNPCGHGACRNCSVYLQECHMCRSIIVSKIKTFF